MRNLTIPVARVEKTDLTDGTRGGEGVEPDPSCCAEKKNKRGGREK